MIYYILEYASPTRTPAQHASKSQEPDTEPDAPDDDDEEVDQLADDDDDDDYKQDEELKNLLAVVPPMKTVKATRERKVVDEGESDGYGTRRRSGRGVKRRRPSTPQAINEADLRRSGRAKRQKTDDVPNLLTFADGESNPDGTMQEKRDAPRTVSEAGSTTIVAEQLAATSLDVPTPREEPTLPAPEDGQSPSTPPVAPDTDKKKGKGGRKSNARFWVYAEVDEEALPKDLPDPDALMRSQRRKSRTGEKKAKKETEAEVNGEVPPPPETNGHSQPVARRGRGRRWRGGRGGGREGKQQPRPTETDDDEVSEAAPVPMLETS